METALTATLNPAVPREREEISASSFDQLMRQHQRRVHRVIFLLVRDDDIADTLTQECFLRAYKKRASFRGECRDHGKNRRTSFWKKLVGLEDRSTNDEPREFATPQPSPERILLAREQLQSILSAVSSLPTQQRSIFLLRFAEEMSLAQIADVLEVKVGTVKAQLARATGKLREMKERQWR